MCECLHGKQSFSPADYEICCIALRDLNINAIFTGFCGSRMNESWPFFRLIYTGNQRQRCVNADAPRSIWGCTAIPRCIGNLSATNWSDIASDIINPSDANIHSNHSIPTPVKHPSHLQFGFEAESLGTQVGYGSSHTGHGGGQTQLGVVPVLTRRLLHYPVVLDL